MKSNQENKKEQVNEQDTVQSEAQEEVVSFDTENLVQEEKQEPTEAEKLAIELQAEKDNYLRLRADYENFRRRNQEAVIKARTAGLALAAETLLPAIDSIDRALGMYGDDDKAREGLLLIKKQITASFEAIGVTEIPTENEKFDPNVHNAVQRVESEGEDVGKVLEVYQRGYKLHDKVIRYSMVKVGVEKEEGNNGQGDLANI